MSSATTTEPQGLPIWLVASTVDPGSTSTPEHSNVLDYAAARTRRDLQYIQFGHAFESIMESIAGGATLTNAIRDWPIELDQGMFVAWINRSSTRLTAYREAKELRSETWAGKIIEVADGVDNAMEDVARSRLKIDTYKWLMSADNRKVYGETKTIDVGMSISITAALAEANGRAARVIEGECVTQDNVEAIEESE